MFSLKSTHRREYQGLLKDLLDLWVSIHTFSKPKNKIFLHGHGLVLEYVMCSAPGVHFILWAY